MFSTCRMNYCVKTTKAKLQICCNERHNKRPSFTFQFTKGIWQNNPNMTAEWVNTSVIWISLPPLVGRVVS